MRGRELSPQVCEAVQARPGRGDGRATLKAQQAARSKVDKLQSDRKVSPLRRACVAAELLAQLRPGAGPGGQAPGLGAREGRRALGSRPSPRLRFPWGSAE